MVGEDIKPGTYKARAVDGLCYWARLDKDSEIIDNDLTEGRTVVTVKKSDYAFETERVHTVGPKVGPAMAARCRCSAAPRCGGLHKRPGHDVSAHPGGRPSPVAQYAELPANVLRYDVVSSTAR